MIKRLRSRGLIPAVLVSVALIAAFAAPPVGAALNRFLSTAYVCSAASISAAPASPSVTGTTIVVTATATCPDAAPQFKFVALWAGTSTWIDQQAFSTMNTWTWNSTGAPAGTERFGVWVKDAQSTQAFDQLASIPYTITAVGGGTCTALSVAAAPASPSIASTSIVVTATATCPHASPTFKFVALWAGNSFWIDQTSFGTGNTWTWNSTGAPGGVEKFGAWVKDASSTAAFDQLASISYTITNGACTVLSLSAAPASPSVHGTSIVLTATSTCPNAGQQYQFLALWATTSSYIIQQKYSSSATWTWNSTGAPAGVERFGVWVKDVSAANTTQADQYFSIAYTIT